MKTPEEVLRQPKYKGLKNLVLICEAMEEYANQQPTEKLHKGDFKMLVRNLRKEQQPTDGLDALRNAFADVWAAKGCGCCCDHAALDEAADRMGRLLEVPRYDDDSGYDFYQFRTPTPQERMERNIEAMKSFTKS